jgi:hypothetical protein
MNKKFYFISMLILMVVLGTFSHARAAANLTIASLQVDLWPEFDRPNVLVIYHITLSPEINLPATMTLHIPGQTGGPFNLAMKDADGMLYNLEYKPPILDNGMLAITFTTPSPEIQFEYYDPALKRQGNTRSYEYRWSGDYAVKSFTVIVQQPTNAANMQIQPDMGNASKGLDGFNYYTKVVGPVEAASSVFIRLTYDKTDNSLSSTSQPVQPVQPVTPKTSGRISFIDALPWTAAALGCVIFVAVLLWVRQTGNKRRQADDFRHDRHHNNRSTLPAKVSNSAGSHSPTVVYCHQCGRVATSGDVFCRSCGSRLRKTDN